MGVRRYRIQGIVQGVGFRPFIHKLTEEFRVWGWIINDSHGVLMEVEAEDTVLDAFIASVRDNAPPLAQIHAILPVPTLTLPGTYHTFSIQSSVSLTEVETLIPPDNYVCPDCLKELMDPADRRYRYPFINCTNCGPRYSIIRRMPYDRAQTTMQKFPLCPECAAEYSDITNRRYHAQPNACPVCGPSLQLTDHIGTPILTDDIVDFCIKQLLAGRIIAVKSNGGFHLACNAADEHAVSSLRQRKKRDYKAFALMIKDTHTARQYVEINAREQQLLESPQRPIMLLKKKQSDLPSALAPAQPNLGIMLPSAPLHYLLLGDPSLPALVMTSGNLSGHPTLHENDKALLQLSGIADYFLLNNRDIHIRVDDSIILCPKLGEPETQATTIFRRSRGYAPYPVTVHTPLQPLLALGAELKNTIALSKHQNVFISQHIGDLKVDSNFEELHTMSEHLKHLLSISPQAVICDLHPSFRSTLFAAEQQEIPVFQVQHHHAHMASCMAENRLEENVIGVIFDGTGYGTDGTIWGGEILVGDYQQFRRAAHLKPFKLLGGDKAIREPFRIGLSLLADLLPKKEYIMHASHLFPALSSMELNVYYQMSLHQLNAYTTTSMGRLFDGISALLGLCSIIEFEAHAAILLESELERDLRMSDVLPMMITDSPSIPGTLIMDYEPLLHELISLIGTVHTRELSRRFHSTIVDTVRRVCQIIREREQLNTVVLSGGVFANEFLFVNTVRLLKSEGFAVYYHNKVPCNDGGIALGQIMVGQALLIKDYPSRA